MTKKEYLDKFEEYRFIDDINNYLKHISYSNFKELLKNQEKTVILIGKDECKYCNDVMTALNSISIDYNVEINYINIENMDTSIAKDVEISLTSLGYNDGFTTPLTIVVENNSLIEYIIGASNEEYFVDIFKENGIIK